MRLRSLALPFTLALMVALTLIGVRALNALIPTPQPQSLALYDYWLDFDYGTPVGVIRPVIVSNGVYRGGAFSVAVPDGWRVITSEAAIDDLLNDRTINPPAVTLVSPDDCAVIHLRAEPTDAPPRPTCEGEYRDEARSIDGVYSYASAPAATWDAFAPLYERAIASITRVN